MEVHYQWRPQLTDAGDEIVLNTAVELASIQTGKSYFAGLRNAKSKLLPAVTPSTSFERIPE